MKVGIKLVKVKKFGIGWCIPHRVVAENAEGGFVRTPPPHGIGLSEVYGEISLTFDLYAEHEEYLEGGGQSVYRAEGKMYQTT